MPYGIGKLSIVAIRAEHSLQSEFVNQLLYGEPFKVLEQRKFFSKIRLLHDDSVGWIDNKQFTLVDDLNLDDASATEFCTDLIEYIQDNDKQLYPICLGAVQNFNDLLKTTFDGNSQSGKQTKSKLIDTAILYLNAPFLNGGRTPFGIDASGFTQMVYRINGYDLKRLPEDQAQQGEVLSFIEECEAGDLAFFDNKESIIDHVGIVLDDNYIIHTYGKVRIDRLDHSGIYNESLRQHTHKLRVLKKII